MGIYTLALFGKKKPGRIGYVRAGGENPARYNFLVFPLFTPLEPSSGVYVFLHIKDPLACFYRFIIIYIGQTDNFNKHLYEELEQRGQWPCILRNGATHIAVLPIEAIPEDLTRIENDIKKGNPFSLCNRRIRARISSAKTRQATYNVD